MTVADLLRATTVLAGASSSTIDELVNASRRTELARQELLYAEGARSSSVGVVVSGTLRVFSSSFDGHENTLSLIHAGELFGELGVLDDMPRSASVGAIRRCELIEIPARAFLLAYDTDPAIARRIVMLLAERVRRVSGGLADLKYLDLGARLAKYLLAESDRQGDAAVSLALTQAELGRLLGGARQTINQVVKSLEQAGLVEVCGRTIRIIDEPGLRSRSMATVDRSA